MFQNSQGTQMSYNIQDDIQKWLIENLLANSRSVVVKSSLPTFWKIRISYTNSHAQNGFVNVSISYRLDTVYYIDN